MSVVAFDVAAVRARFSALDRPTAFLDAPGGTQAPDSVIEAMASYLRESNANLGGAFETSRRSDALVVSAHHAAARFLGCGPDEVGFGQNMTTLNFALTRTLGRSSARATRSSSRGSTTTATSRRGSTSPTTSASSSASSTLARRTPPWTWPTSSGS